MSNINILLIDDSQFIHDSFDAFFRKDDHVKITATLDGTKARELATSVKPDIIFLDYILVGTDGLTVLKELKKDVACRDIPVIMISGKENAYDAELALMHGACQFVHKPLSGKNIRSIVMSTCEGSENVA